MTAAVAYRPAHGGYPNAQPRRRRGGCGRVTINEIRLDPPALRFVPLPPFEPPRRA